MAEKYELPLQVIELVYMSQWQKLREEFRSFEFNTVKLPGWGKYVASKKKLSYLRPAYEAKKERLLKEKLDKENKKNGTNGEETKDN